MFAILVRIFFDILYLLSLVFWGMFVWIVTWLPYIALCVCIPIAFSIWLFSVDTGLVYLFELLWTKRGVTARRTWRGIVTFFIHLILWRCVHAGNCKCFQGWIPVEEHEILLADVEPSLRTQLTTVLADFSKEKQNNTSLNVSSSRWRERALAAEKLNRICRREHRDLEDFRKANAEFRKRVSDLQKENADLRKDYNLERRSKARHPLFEDHPGNLAQRNRELEQQVHILLGDIKNAHEGLDRSQPFSTQERVKSEAEITRLQKMVTSYDEEIHELNERNSELEKLGKLSNDDAKTVLRNRILDLQNQLRVTTAERNDAIRDTAKAEKLLATCQEGGNDGPPGNTDWNAGISGVGKLEAIIALFKETDVEVGRLSGLRKYGGSATDSGLGFPPPPLSPFASGSPPPLPFFPPPPTVPVTQNQLGLGARGSSNDDAIRELTYIYDCLKVVMIEIKKVEPEQSVNLLNSIELLKLVPGLFKSQEEAKARFAAYQAQIADLIQERRIKNEIHEVQLAQMLQHLNDYKQMIQEYHEAARQARERMDPGTATDPDYTVGDFIPQAVAAVEMLNTKIEQQMKFNRSTPNERHAQLESLQAENIILKVKLKAAAPMYHKVMMEADRLRLEIETQAINSRRPEDKRRHAVYCNLDAVLHETSEFIDDFKMECPDFVVPKWVQDLYIIVYKDPNDLPTVEETNEVARKIRLVVDWMQEENWPGSKPEWHDSIVEGFPPSKEDKLGIVLQKLMVRIDRALNELEIHTYEVWANGKTEKKAADAANQISHTPKGCTCPPQQPGTFTVPGSPCPVCAALESDSKPKGSFTDQLNKNRERRNRAEEQNTKGTDKASCSKKSPASDDPWGPFSSAKTARAAYGSTKPTRPDTSRYNISGITGLATISPRFDFDSMGHFQSLVNRRNAPSPLRLGKTKSSGLDDLPNLEWVVPTYVKTGTSGPSLSPGLLNVASSNDDFMSPTSDDALMAENPVYWRKGMDPVCNEAWAVVQGLQEGLRAHNIDVTKYKWRGRPLKCLNFKEVDNMKPQPGTGKSILETQRQSLWHQVTALLSQVWMENITDLGAWDTSPYNPKDQSHKQDNGKGSSTGSSDEPFSTPTAAGLDKMKENERRNKHQSIYVGAATGWERTNVYTVWQESIALQKELEKRWVDCYSVRRIVASDFLKLADDYIGQNMTSADVLGLQLDFVTAQVIDLLEIWRRNEIGLGPCSALPFYREPSAPRSIVESLTARHDWRKKVECKSYWDGVARIQAHFKKHDVRGWRELKKWEVDSCEGRAEETLPESQTSLLVDHIKDLHNLWSAKEDVLGKSFLFQQHSCGWEVIWPDGW